MILNLTLISSLFADGIQEEVGEGLFCEVFDSSWKPIVILYYLPTP